MPTPGFCAEVALFTRDGRYPVARREGRDSGQAVAPQNSSCDIYMSKAVHYAELAIDAIEHHHTAAALRYLDMMETYGTAWEGCVAVEGPSL